MPTNLEDVPFGLASGARERIAEGLQSWLPSLIAFGLRLKQAHWNLRGERFKSVHEQLDEILVDVRAASDDVAERIVTLGAAADGRPSTVAEGSAFSDFPGGRLSVAQSVQLCCDDLAVVVRIGRDCIATVSDEDPVSEDLSIGIVQSLEKHHWMLQSQQEESA